MTNEDFTEFAVDCRTKGNECDNPMYMALGMVSEAGEAGDVVKKAIRDSGGEFDTERLAELLAECGDTLWYMVNLLDQFGLTIADAMDSNSAKLFGRKKTGRVIG